MVFFKAGSWSGVIRLAGDASRPSLARLSSASCLEMPLARQTTPDHLPTWITFLTVGIRARAKSKEKSTDKGLWLYSLLLMLLLTLLLIFHTSEKRDVIRKVGRSGWLCSGISRHDAEDKHYMDVLEASTAKPTTPHQLLNLYTTFERHPFLFSWFFILRYIGTCVLPHPLVKVNHYWS